MKSYFLTSFSGELLLYIYLVIIWVVCWFKIYIWTLINTRVSSEYVWLKVQNNNFKAGHVQFFSRQVFQHHADNVSVDFGLWCQTSFQMQLQSEGWKKSRKSGSLHVTEDHLQLCRVSRRFLVSRLSEAAKVPSVWTPRLVSVSCRLYTKYLHTFLPSNLRKHRY